MGKRIGIAAVIIIVLLGFYSASTYNHLVNSSQQVQAAWAQVQNVYQRRLDLIPNLVATVKGYTTHERETLIAVTKARAAISAAPASAMPTANNLAQIDQTQTVLNSALGRLMVVVERYPDLKASQNYLALQVELAGTENRIAVERQRFNQAALAYNTTIRQFPNNILARWFGFTPTAYFQADTNAQTAPKVSF